MMFKKKDQPKKEPADTRKKIKKPPKAITDSGLKEGGKLYPVRKGKLMRIGRIALWVILAFIFLKGVIVSVRPDSTAEVKQLISEFKEDNQSKQAQDNEVMAFAEAFATEYLTYSDSAGADEYADRVSRYAADSIVSEISRIQTGTAAQVVHALAYKQESYSDTQTDVWVQLEVTYTNKITSADGIETTETNTENTILKVPVFMEGGSYIVEDYPVFVNDIVKVSDYKGKTYSGNQTDSDTCKAIKAALANFFEAYYQSEQSVINYYLTTDADTADFIGLNGRVQFNEITAIQTFFKTQEDTEHFIAVVTVEIADANGAVMKQNYNVELLFKDKQYYISAMNTRNANLNF